VGGNGFQILADIDAAPSEATHLAAKTVEWLVLAEIIVPDRTDCVLSADFGYAPGARHADAVANPHLYSPSFGADGVDVRTGRTVFHGGQSGIDRISCPHCATAASWDAVSDTIDVWFDTGLGDHQCATCGGAAGLNDWRWEPPWAFGYFGLQFWNWPELSPSFIAELSGRLGHRVVVVADTL
jgi:hypothetical protein